MSRCLHTWKKSCLRAGYIYIYYILGDYPYWGPFLDHTLHVQLLATQFPRQQRCLRPSVPDGAWLLAHGSTRLGFEYRSTQMDLVETVSFFSARNPSCIRNPCWKESVSRGYFQEVSTHDDWPEKLSVQVPNRSGFQHSMYCYTLI